MKGGIMKRLKFFVLLIFLMNFSQEILTETTLKSVENAWPRRVLITNDNGINDIKIIELARAFAKVAETYVVAPLVDRSGASNYMSLGERKPFVEVEKCDLGAGIVAYGLDGYPADCVLFALSGPLKDNPPDLLVSGINGGPNLGIEWFGSGTIGAARTAALGGLPAIAVSGLNKQIPGAVNATTKWMVKFAQCPVVKNLEKGQYLTISIPRVPPTEIMGIKVVPRATLQISALPTFVLAKKNKESLKRQLWILQPPLPSRKITKAEGDIAAYRKNFIVIVPMNVCEVDYDYLPELQKHLSDFPSWQASPARSGKNKISSTE